MCRFRWIVYGCKCIWLSICKNPWCVFPLPSLQSRHVHMDSLREHREVGGAASSSSGEMKERNRGGEGNSPRPCAQLMPERDTLHAFDFPTDSVAWTLISYQRRTQKGSWTWGHLPSRDITDMALLPSASLGTHIPSVPLSMCSSGNRTARLASAFWTLGNRGWNELQGVGLVPEGVLSTS